MEQGDSAPNASKQHQSVWKFPTTAREIEVLEQSFLDEFDKLSLQEHEKIQFDVHGIGQLEEDPSSVESKLDYLQAELATIEDKPAFDKAQKWNPGYVNNSNFRLMFLRSRSFDVKQAASLLVLHFECKLKLFGDGEILGRDVRLSDLDAESTEALESGSVQIFPTRDVAGRSIMCSSSQWKEDLSIGSVSRAQWYFYMVALKDEDSQKSGFVSIWYNKGSHVREPSFHEQVHASVVGVPGKLAGLHFCDKVSSPTMVGVRHFLYGESQFRFRSHIGDPQAVAFELQTFGIPTNDGPMQKDGTWSLRFHREWMQMQRSQEAKLPVDAISDRIIVPRRFDVLFGKSKRTREHTGNRRLVHLCEMYGEKYQSANRIQKTEIAEHLVEVIHESKGRFLKMGECGWTEVTDHEARDKVSHFFRNKRNQATTDKQQQVERSECNS